MKKKSLQEHFDSKQEEIANLPKTGTVKVKTTKCQFCEEDHLKTPCSASQPRFSLPTEISRPYREMIATRKIKRTLIIAAVSFLMLFAALALISLVTSAIRVKNQTRLDYVTEQACMNLPNRLKGKSDAAKHLEFQKCADMYVKSDLESVYE